MDQWGDHALVCGCGGDRVTRHNLVRDVVHSAANDKESLGAVLEKPRLVLPHDPSDDDRPLDPSSPCRRPADVWVPRGASGGQEAWDFSITNALRLGPALPDPAAFSGVFSSVESRKRAFLNTASQCAQAGISFYPSRQLAAAGLIPFGRLSLGSPARVIVVLPSATLMQFQDRAAHLVHPSQGKRARGLEACSRTIRVSLLSSWFVSVV